VRNYFGTNGDAVLGEYPSSDFSTPQDALIAVMTDGRAACFARRLLRAAVATQTEPAFRYVYAHTDDSGPMQKYAAGHALELPFVFHNFGPKGFAPSAAELTLSQTIIGYWTRFAATGDPN